MNTELNSKIEKIVALLDEKKGEEIEVFNLEDSDYIAKVVVLVNSLGGKHTSALYDNLRVFFREQGEKILGADESDDWIVVDLGDILIHIMTPQYRMRYSIEEFLKELKEGKFKADEEL
jgi:ribosome silencing factor RsfS/YbeB/iojap